MLHASLALAGLCLNPLQAEAQAPQRDLAELMPETTLFYVEGPGLSEFFGQGLSHPLLQRVLDSELGPMILQEFEASPKDMVAFVETLIDRPLFATASQLVNRGIAFGMHPGASGKPAITLAARSEDDLLWSESLHKVLTLAAAGGAIPRSAIDPGEGPAGEDSWQFGSDLSLSQWEGSVLLSNDVSLRNSLSTRLCSASGELFTSSERFDSLRRDAHGEALFWSFLDLKGVLALSEGRGPFAEFSKIPTKPAVQMILGSGFASLAKATELAATLDLNDEGLQLTVGGHGIEAGTMALLLPPVEGAAIALPRPTSREAARLVVYRDFGEIFAKRAELFPAESLPAFSRASSELAPLLGGLDLGEDLLPGLSPWLRVVVREIDFSEAAVPELPLPAIVLMVDLDEPERLGPWLSSSFQTSIGVVNIERAQQGKKPMLLFLEQHEGIQFSAARFLPPGPEEGVDVEYNLVPACALVGKTFLLGSHLSLVREVAEQLRTGDLVEVPADRDRLELKASVIAELLTVNRLPLVMNAVLNDGKTREQAENETNALIALVGLFESARVTTQYSSAETVEVSVDLQFADKR